VSIYKDKLTKVGVVEQIKKVKLAFPSLPQGFYDILTERAAKNKFTDNQLRDSVNYVIDNCIYPTPTIANFMSYDKKIKFYNYSQILKLNSDVNVSNIFEFYKPVKVSFTKKRVWASVEDIDKYNLTKYKSKNITKES